jgi:type IX secretion system PorP/SprF family membrane protein
MRKYWIYVVLVLAGLGSLDLAGQQLPMYTQYLQNGFMVNPAMAGHDGYTSFNTTARQQWLGFKDAPRTYSASWQTRLLKKSYKIKNKAISRGNKLVPSTRGRVGLGAYVLNDVNANVARTGVSFTYAYHIIMNNQQLSFGLAAKAFQYRLYKDALSFGEDGDPVLNDLNPVGYSPDADVGVLFRSHDYFVGFSVSNLLETSVLIGANKLPGYGTDRHYWLMGGYKFELDQDFALEPGLMLRTPENWIPMADLSLRLYYMDLFWGGISYRTNKSIIALVGVRIESLFFGYSFDLALSEIGHFNYGSHEITLSVKLGDNARRYKWLNRY